MKMGVFIKATVRCDHYNCKNELDVEFEMTSDSKNNIPSFELSKYHEGWNVKTTQLYGRENSCECPEHNYYHQEQLKEQKEREKQKANKKGK